MLWGDLWNTQKDTEEKTHKSNEGSYFIRPLVIALHLWFYFHLIPYHLPSVLTQAEEKSSFSSGVILDGS